MQPLDATLTFSASDLSNFAACGHLSQLDRGVARGEVGKPRPYDDPSLDALKERGRQHERAVLERLRARGLRVVEIPDIEATSPHGRRVSYEQRAQATLAAMQASADIVYQGCLFDGAWVGFPDFLLRVEQPSALGTWSYEVVDAKLAREAKGGAVLQISLYSHLLGKLLDRTPLAMHLALGGPEARTETFRVADFAAYFRSVKRRFEERMGTPAAIPHAPDPVTHCDICRWAERCEKQRRDVDHLSFVAGITKRQRSALATVDVVTMKQLAGFKRDGTPPDGVGRAALERVRAQARVQVEGRERGEPYYELIDEVIPEQGLAALPPPSEGDLFFDLEGAPYALDDGIEYLFGVCDRTGVFSATWALTREEEKAAFEAFIDDVMARLDDHPDLHIYHFGHYETTALKKLMARYATREDEVDRLLRGKVFVDLHRVVRQGVRASVESYSIKKLERFYGYTRDVDLRAASLALASFEAWLELGGAHERDAALFAQIEGYNRDDVLSTLRLAEWVEARRTELEAKTGEAVPRPEKPDPTPPPGVQEEEGEVGPLVRALTAGVPADESERTPEQSAGWLLAQLLGFHRREKKSMWWEYFHRRTLSEQELIEDRSCLGALEYVGAVGTVKKSTLHRYRFPRQEFDLDEGDTPHDPATRKPAGTVHAADDVACTIDLKRGNSSTVAHPAALVPLNDVGDKELRQSIRRVARAVVGHGFYGAGNPYRAASDLLLRHPPRTGQPHGAELLATGEDVVRAARRLVSALDRSVLAIQGPPGAGKTYTGARMIVELLRAGKRVGITATSHKVISNLLVAVEAAAQEIGESMAGVQAANDEEKWCGLPNIQRVGSAGVRKELDNGVPLAAGTAWLWSREDMSDAVDVLFVDEAGQFSLANALAIAPAAKSLVLLGDPQQLQQPQQGVHPPGAEVSALEHLLEGQPTIESDRGLFLPETWRLHPSLTEFTSEIYYADRLASHAGLERQAVRGLAPLDGSGLRLQLVEHDGNTNESPEEVDAVAALIRGALDGAVFIDRQNAARPLTLGDILVVAPYNAHVAALKAALPAGARVGTVDKFQGQEAAVVIFSMATSSAEDAPRGMEFLYNPNRLNVATSRARCLALIVASPRLLVPECRSPRQMWLANGVCRFVEKAGEADEPPELTLDTRT